jgi:carbamoyltransferase
LASRTTWTRCRSWCGYNENEPIVCSPEEAIAVLTRTKMDALATGNYLARKRTATL